MKGLRITSVKLSFYEDEHHAAASVIVEWCHSMSSAASVLKMCGGVDLTPAAMLESAGIDNKALKTVRTFRFESREDALLAYDKFEEVFRAQDKEEVVTVLNAD